MSGVKYKMVAKTLQGLEQTLADELKALGAENIQLGKRAVLFEGNKHMLYKANIWCRTALKILVNIHSFPTENEQELYDGISKMNWEEYFTVDETLAVEAVLHYSNLNHSMYAALKVKDAIVDQFRTKHDKRPSVDTVAPTVLINVHIVNNICTIALDSSGDSLHKCGYRAANHEAPLNEVLAAGMVLMSGWDKEQPLIDFMCGSATILIEAAMIALNRAPGMLREQFAFERWHDFDKEMLKEIKDVAKFKALKELPTQIIGCDISTKAVDQALENIQYAFLTDFIDIHKMDFQDFQAPEGDLMIISNPPYGERIQTDKLFELYKAIGSTLKQKYTGCSAWILTSNMEAAAQIGLRASSKRSLVNGSLDCKFFRYDMYKGTRN